MTGLWLIFLAGAAAGSSPASGWPPHGSPVMTTVLPSGC